MKLLRLRSQLEKLNCLAHSAPTRVFNLIANVNKQLIAYFGQIQLIAIL